MPIPVPEWLIEQKEKREKDPSYDFVIDHKRRGRKSNFQLKEEALREANHRDNGDGGEQTSPASCEVGDGPVSQRGTRKLPGCVPPLPKTQQSVYRCNCVNSSCLKNYCECFRNGFRCGPKCYCENCGNQIQQKPSTSQKDASNNILAISPVLSDENGSNSLSSVQTKTMTRPAIVIAHCASYAPVVGYVREKLYGSAFSAVLKLETKSRT